MAIEVFIAFSAASLTPSHSNPGEEARAFESFPILNKFKLLLYIEDSSSQQASVMTVCQGLCYFAASMKRFFVGGSSEPWLEITRCCVSLCLYCVE